MRLRSSREPSSTSATGEQRPLVRLNAHHDAEVSYRIASLDASDVSSACHQGAAAVTTDSLSAKCLQSGTNRGRRKWTYDENIELMHCFYLAKRDGVGYRERLKRLWDLRNPNKTVISVNTLCCHARNVQTVHMLPDHELRRIEQSCARRSVAPAASEFTPETFIGTTESLGVSPVHVVEPSAEPSIVIPDDTVALRTLSNKFAEVASASGAEGPCLPKICDQTI